MSTFSTSEEFSQVPVLINRIWGVTFDVAKIAVWHNILGGLKVKGLIAALEALAITSNCKYHPSIKEIVDKYEELKKRQDRELRDRKIKSQNLLTDSQYECPICDNTGDYAHDDGRYVYLLRCLCSRGRDLNKWSENNITKGMLWLNKETGRQEDLYVPEMRDVLSDEEVEIIKAKKISEKAERKSTNHDEQLRIIKAMVMEMAI